MRLISKIFENQGVFENRKIETSKILGSNKMHNQNFLKNVDKKTTSKIISNVFKHPCLIASRPS